MDSFYYLRSYSTVGESPKLQKKTVNFSSLASVLLRNSHGTKQQRRRRWLYLIKVLVCLSLTAQTPSSSSDFLPQTCPSLQLFLLLFNIQFSRPQLSRGFFPNERWEEEVMHHSKGKNEHSGGSRFLSNKLLEKYYSFSFPPGVVGVLSFRSLATNHRSPPPRVPPTTSKCEAGGKFIRHFCIIGEAWEEEEEDRVT